MQIMQIMEVTRAIWAIVVISYWVSVLIICPMCSHVLCKNFVVWLTRILMIFWLILSLYMPTLPVTASTWDISIASIVDICAFAQHIRSSETAIPLDRQYALQIVHACAIDPERPMITGDIQTLWEDLFLIQEPTLFEAVLYLLPRNREEKWDFAHMLSQHKDDVLTRLASSQTQISQFLRARFLFDQFGILHDEMSKKELIAVVQGWSDHRDIHTPYIDAWSYFLLDTSLEPRLTSAQVMRSHDIFINWASMQYVWNRKQALMAIRENMPWILTESLHNMRTIQSHRWGSPFTWLLSADFVAAFGVHSELLNTTYFDPAYITFIEDTIALTSWLKGTSLFIESKKYLAIVDQLIALIESQKLGTWEKMSKQWYTGGNPLYPIVDVLMTLASTDGDTITSLISRHQSFFEQDEMIPYRDNIEKAIKNSTKHTLTWTLQTSTWVIQWAISNDAPPMSGHSITGSHQPAIHTETINTQKNQWFLYGILGCIFLFLLAWVTFFIKKHT